MLKPWNSKGANVGLIIHARRCVWWTRSI